MTTYSDLVNIPTFWKKKEDFKEERWDVKFYCRDCHKVTETTRLNPDKYIYECNTCKSKNISIWTEESLSDFYVK
ncbi:MAG: hypothetical protein ACD_2C00182G0004 [uncultured bacterium (gcode 4)]|uniref:Uncharacterized protein n=1 Tax=uncultured bacterium (gcode 4) TaxID=1234023 RepID=K2GG56_9BACT|nr:MAG: hypothetical protein ACD_2C00182G0004 [uncultured bacterium (gcode 4)]